MHAKMELVKMGSHLERPGEKPRVCSQMRGKASNVA